MYIDLKFIIFEYILVFEIVLSLLSVFDVITSCVRNKRVKINYTLFNISWPTFVFLGTRSMVKTMWHNSSLYIHYTLWSFVTWKCRATINRIVTFISYSGCAKAKWVNLHIHCLEYIFFSVLYHFICCQARLLRTVHYRCLSNQASLYIEYNVN